MTSYGNKGYVLGFYSEIYQDNYFTFSFESEKTDFIRHIIVIKSDLDKYLTMTLSHHEMFVNGSILTLYSNLDINLVNNDIIKKITNYPIKNYEINLKSFDSEYNDYDLYECDIFEISRYGQDSLFSNGYYRVYENLFR